MVKLDEIPGFLNFGMVLARFARTYMIYPD